MKTEAEIGRMRPQAQKHMELPEAGQALEAAQPCQHLELRFLSSRTVRE